MIMKYTIRRIPWITEPESMNRAQFAGINHREKVSSSNYLSCKLVIHKFNFGTCAPDCDSLFLWVVDENRQPLIIIIGFCRCFGKVDGLRNVNEAKWKNRRDLMNPRNERGGIFRSPLNVQASYWVSVASHSHEFSRMRAFHWNPWSVGYCWSILEAR